MNVGTAKKQSSSYKTKPLSSIKVDKNERFFPCQNFVLVVCSEHLTRSVERNITKRRSQHI